MQKLYFHPEQDGFYGAYYPNRKHTSKAMIVMFGDLEDALTRASVKWLHSLDCHVMALPASTPEQAESAVTYLKAQEIEKIGICSTGIVSLAVASRIPDIHLTIAFTPCDCMEEKIQIENIHGRLILVGAEDDSLTCRYIRRIDERLQSIPHHCRYRTWIYAHGSHFCFPQSMLENILPIGSGLALALGFESLRDFPIESRQTRIDIDRKLSYLISRW